MAYEPTNWKTGDVVTSSKLNKLENGVANSAGFLKVTTSHDDQTNADIMDKTWQEIHDALTAGYYVSNPIEDPFDSESIHAYIIIGVSKGPQQTYNVIVKTPDGEAITFIAHTASDYPFCKGE